MNGRASKPDSRTRNATQLILGTFVPECSPVHVVFWVSSLQSQRVFWLRVYLGIYCYRRYLYYTILQSNNAEFAPRVPCISPRINPTPERLRFHMGCERSKQRDGEAVCSQALERELNDISEELKSCSLSKGDPDLRGFKIREMCARRIAGKTTSHVVSTLYQKLALTGVRSASVPLVSEMARIRNDWQQTPLHLSQEALVIDLKNRQRIIQLELSARSVTSDDAILLFERKCTANRAQSFDCIRPKTDVISYKVPAKCIACSTESFCE